MSEQYVAIDFDGTVVTHDYPEVGMEVPGAVDTIKALIARGYKIILWTMRSGDTLQDAIDWFTERGIELYGVNKNPDQDWSTSPKAYAQTYIDDAALGCPLMRSPDHERPVVNWDRVQLLLNIRTPRKRLSADACPRCEGEGEIVVSASHGLTDPCPKCHGTGKKNA